MKISKALAAVWSVGFLMAAAWFMTYVTQVAPLWILPAFIACLCIGFGVPRFIALLAALQQKGSGNE